MEKNLKKFKINKKIKNSYTISINILKIIKRFSNSQNSTQITERFSDLFDIPHNVIKIKYKKLIYNTLNYKQGNFSNNINIDFKVFLRELIKFLYLTIITFFSIKNVKYKKYDFILSGVEDQRSLDRYRSLLDRFKNPLVISKNYSLKDKKK